MKAHRAALKRSRRRHVNDPDKVDAFWAAAEAQRVCAKCGKPTRTWDAHHVVEKQELRNRGLDVWDPRNALRLCGKFGPTCHGQHTNAAERVPLSALTDENIEFAFDVLGAFAYDYLKRRYAGEDWRVEVRLCKSCNQVTVPCRPEEGDPAFDRYCGGCDDVMWRPVTP